MASKLLLVLLSLLVSISLFCNANSQSVQMEKGNAYLENKFRPRFNPGGRFHGSGGGVAFGGGARIGGGFVFGGGVGLGGNGGFAYASGGSVRGEGFSNGDTNGGNFGGDDDVEASSGGKV